MYLIDIVVQADKIPASDLAKTMDAHREWFAKYFDAGKFLLLGPYLDKSMAGLIIAQAQSRAELDGILSEDVLYPDLAEYTVNEFKAAMCADNIHEYAD